jgi:hypothetical protein
MLYKLTDENDCTRDGTLWGPGVTHTAAKGKAVLCSNTVIHAYTHPLLAVFLNPIHANITLTTAHLWTARGRVVVNDHGLKVGCKTLTTLERIELPVVTNTQRIAFGILAAKKRCHEPSWNKWADDWLSGKDRSTAAAAAAWAAKDAAAAAVAAWAAHSAAWAAKEAAAAADFDLVAIAKQALNY